MGASRATPPTISSLLSMGFEILAEQSVDDPRNEAEYILSHLLDLKRTELVLNRDHVVEEHIAGQYLSAVKSRADGIPVQHITGIVDFHQVSLSIDGRALIPRPETEVLVSAVIDEIRSRAPGEGGLDILEIGTGSGAIACALAQEFSGDIPIHIIATDISQEALELASHNVTRCGFEHLVELRKGDAFEPVDRHERFDCIVSNPPYVSLPERSSLPREIRDHEPEVALFAGETGYEMIEIIIEGSLRFLRRRGFLALEIGMGQHRRVEMLLRTRGFSRIFLKKDLAGVRRIALASDRL